MTEWGRYVFYECRHRLCQDNCINLIESPAAQTKQCWSCYFDHDAEDLRTLDNHLPESGPLTV